MSLNLNLKDNIRGMSTFQYYRDGELWYLTEAYLLFPVSVKELDTAQVGATEKSMLLMRYIRKHIESMAAAQDA